MISVDEPGHGARACPAPAANTDVTQRPGTRGRLHHHLKEKLTTQDLRKHFGTIEPKEIALEITRMGQRELQRKFRDVYEAPTSSNNNNWLRRKLMEAARCMHLYKPQGRAHLSGHQNPTKRAGSLPKAMCAVGGVRGVPPLLTHPAPSSSTAKATKCGLQATPGEVCKIPWNLKPSCLKESTMADPSYGSDSSDTSKCEERPRELAAASSTSAAQWAYNLGFVRTWADGLPRYKTSELLAKDEHGPTVGASADLACPQFRNCNSGSETEMSLDVSPYTHPGTNHGERNELLLSDMHSPPLHATLAALGDVPVQEHTRPEYQCLIAQHSGDSNMVIGGRHGRESEPAPDLHTPPAVRTLGSSSATPCVNARLHMESLPRSMTAEQGDKAPWGLAALHLQLPADHRESSLFGMSSERLALAPVTPCVSSMAAQTTVSQLESCCGVNTYQEDTDLLDADLLVQSLQFLRPDEALHLIEQNISAIDAEQQLLNMYCLV